jgi:hypothetical protein
MRLRDFKAKKTLILLNINKKEKRVNSCCFRCYFREVSDTLPSAFAVQVRARGTRQRAKVRATLQLLEEWEKSNCAFSWKCASCFYHD